MLSSTHMHHPCTYYGQQMSMETTPQTQPQQQPAGETLSGNYPQAVPLVSSSSSSSGSIGPFFAVISVLTVLAFLSCVLGRRLTRDQAVATPLESINDRISCVGWLKRKCRQLQCMATHYDRDVEVGPKAMIMSVAHEKNSDAKVKEGDGE